MNDARPSIILTCTAAVLGTTGLAMLFAPQETTWVVAGSEASESAGQLISAGLLSLAILDWAGRGAVYGGIYGRPIVLANFLFGFILATTTFRAALEFGGLPWLATVWGVLQTAAFGWLLFRGSPVHSGGAVEDE